MKCYNSASCTYTIVSYHLDQPSSVSATGLLPHSCVTSMMELINVAPSEITFTAQVGHSEYSVIFVVVIRNNTYAMKVVSEPCQSFVFSNAHHQHHYYERDPHSSPSRETIPYVCEATAYRRLKEFGVCDSGIVPQFYGTIENLDARQCMPHLYMFLDDKGPPNAILMEYIPNMQPLHPTNYSKRRMENFINGIEQIHRALVEHSDTEPRNMMVVQGDPERAIWIDFDRAQTLHAKSMTEIEKERISFEKELVVEMDECMVSDQSARSVNLSEDR